MSTEIETTPQNDSETDPTAATEGTIPIDFDATESLENETDDSDDGNKLDRSIGEWSLCASMIFLAGYLVVVMFWMLGHPVWETLISLDREIYRTEFPVGVATILLLISVLSAFCSFISLVADQNNRNTLLVRLLTIGPLLPTATAGFMIWIIIQRGAGNSILENFLG
jgi:hypothetical protein|tara:strand:+ start:853 stop:1356 length:504 start_codon:yes stop_codon:yes gene_type:complete